MVRIKTFLTFMVLPFLVFHLAHAQHQLTNEAPQKVDTNVTSDSRNDDGLPLSKIENSLPGLSQYAIPLVSAILAAFFGYVITLLFTKRSEEKSNQEARLFLSRSIAKESIGKMSEVANVYHCLDTRKELENLSNLNKVLAYGNWLEFVALQWREDMLDVEFLEKFSMLSGMREFCDKYNRAQSDLANAQSSLKLKACNSHWKNLCKLANSGTGSKKNDVT